MTELRVKKLYESIDIDDPHQLTIDNISTKLNIDVYYWGYTSAIMETKGEYSVFLNQSLNYQQQWMVFGHEMKHYCSDKGTRFYLKKQFLDYIEIKADYFAYHFCVPTFLLRELKGVTVYDVMNIFNVDFDFAFKRLEMYKNQIMVVAESKAVYR